MDSLNDRDTILGLSFMVSAVLGLLVSRLYKQVDGKADKGIVENSHAAILRELDHIQSNQARADQKLNFIMTQSGDRKSP